MYHAIKGERRVRACATHRALFQNIQNPHFGVSNNGKNIIDVDNDVIYKCAKNHSEIYCILGWEKITNEWIWVGEQYTFSKS